MLKTDRILALDIGASSIKMAEFIPLKSGGLELVNYAVRPLGLDPHDDADRAVYIVSTIQEIMAEQGIKGGPVLFSVSGQSVFSRYVKLPPVDQDKVYQIVSYEAQQNVPFPIDEVVWDYQLIGAADGELDVMLAAIKGDIISGLTDCVEQAGLLPDLVDVAPMALYNAVRYNYPDLDACTLLVDIGARSTDLVFIEGTRLFSRSIPVAGNAITQQIMRELEIDFAEAEELKKAQAFVALGGAADGAEGEAAAKVAKAVRSVMTRLHAEINRSINFYRGQQDGSQPELILLTGGSSVIPNTDVFFKEKLKADVDYLNPFNNVAVSEAIDVDQIGEDAYTLGEVVGLGLRRVLSCPIEINLMPQRVLEEKQFRKQQPVLLAAAFGVVLILVIWCFYFFRLTQLGRQELEQAQQEVKALQSVEERLRVPERGIAELEDQIGQLHTLIEEKTAWVEMLDQVYALLPEGIWLTRVEPLEQVPEPAEPVAQDSRRRRDPQPVVVEDAAPTRIDRVRIAGLGYTDVVRTADPIYAFRDALQQAPLFKPSTEIERIPPVPAGTYVREFSIVLLLEEPLSL
jgi:type IV pilus assembly protein PilM